jgi:hypothetical protein
MIQNQEQTGTMLLTIEEPYREVVFQRMMNFDELGSSTNNFIWQIFVLANQVMHMFQ